MSAADASVITPVLMAPNQGANISPDERVREPFSDKVSGKESRIWGQWIIRAWAVMAHDLKYAL
jgi:hypothetical protein